MSHDWISREELRDLYARDLFEKNLAFISAGETNNEDQTQQGFLSCFYNQVEFFKTFNPSSISSNECMQFFIIFMEKWPSHNDELIQQFIKHTHYREWLFGCDNFLNRIAQMESETAKDKVLKAILDNPDIYFSVFQNKNVLVEFCRKFPSYEQQAEKQFRPYVVSSTVVSDGSQVEPSNTMKGRLSGSDQHFQSSLAKIARGERLYKEGSRHDSFVRCFDSPKKFAEAFYASQWSGELPLNPNQAAHLFIIFMERWPNQNYKLIEQFKVNAYYRKILFFCDDFLKRVAEMQSETAKTKVVNCILDNPEIFSLVITNGKSLVDFCTKFPAYKNEAAEKYFKQAKSRVATFKPKAELKKALSQIPEPVDVMDSYFQVDKTVYPGEYGHSSWRTSYHHFESGSPSEMADLFVNFMEEHPDHHDQMFNLMKDYDYLKHLLDGGVLEKISKMKSKETQNKIVTFLINNDNAMALIGISNGGINYKRRKEFLKCFPEHETEFTKKLQPLDCHNVREAIKYYHQYPPEWAWFHGCTKVYLQYQRDMPELFKQVTKEHLDELAETQRREEAKKAAIEKAKEIERASVVVERTKEAYGNIIYESVTRETLAERKDSALRRGFSSVYSMVKSLFDSCNRRMKTEAPKEASVIEKPLSQSSVKALGQLSVAAAGSPAKPASAPVPAPEKGAAPQPIDTSDDDDLVLELDSSVPPSP